MSETHIEMLLKVLNRIADSLAQIAINIEYK